MIMSSNNERQTVSSMSNEQSNTMWSGRFREPLDPRFEQWQRSFPFDWRLLPQEIAASEAHARMIADAGVLTSAELLTMLSGLKAVLANTSVHAAEIVASAPDAEDVHHFVEIRLIGEIGELARKLHTGRSRNEQIATDMRLFVRESIDAIVDGLHEWLRALLDQAENAADAVMPAYTHLQRAEPVLLAHWLLAYVAMLERDSSRLLDCRKRLNLCPLGSGAVAGATLRLDRSIAAAELGFDEPTPNSMDATSDRDFLLEFAQALATLAIHISRFAEELTLFATAEFGFVDLAERFSTGSSAMPQKKNPDLTELLRGKCGRIAGAVTTLSVLLKGLPLAYNKDLQEGQQPVFEAADAMLGMLSVLPEFTRSLRFRTDRMRAAAQTGYLNAMAAATYLANKGVPFRTAHEFVGRAVRLGLETGRELGELSIEELRTICPEFAEDFFAAITLEATLDCHDVMGGTARARVRAALAGARERLGVAVEVEGVG